MEENPTAGLIDETSDIEIDYDDDGNPIAPPKKKVITNYNLLSFNFPQID